MKQSIVFFQPTKQSQWLGPVSRFCLIALTFSIADLHRAAAAENGNEWPVAQKQLVVVGTYTSGASKGIYLYHFDPVAMRLYPTQVVEGVENPSFVAIHPTGKYLLAVNELAEFNGKPGGGVSSFQLDPKTGTAKFLNSQSTKGAAPCHIVIGKKGTHAFVANYSGGSVAAFPIEQDGQLRPASAFVQHEGHSVHPRQAAPHAHSINLDAANRFAVVADLGLDKVLIYKLNPANGWMSPNAPPAVSLKPGAGPRHFAFHPNGKLAFVINELQSTLTSFKYDSERGVLSEVQTVTTLPEDFQGQNSTAEVVVHPSGKFVYGSNRGHHSIAVFQVDEETGVLTASGHVSSGGETPRNFALDQSGRYMFSANQGTHRVVVMQIDSKTGLPLETGLSIDVPNPVCIRTRNLD